MLLKLIGSLTHRTLDRLGDWNPQLLRELKGRLKGLPVLTAIGLSVLVQFVICLGFVSALPGAVVADDLVLATYPQIYWSAVSQLPLDLQTAVLPTDASAQTVLSAKGLFIQSLETEPAVWGEVPGDARADAQLQPGDRLLALDGVPVAELEADIKADVSGDRNAVWESRHMDAHQQAIDDLMRGTTNHRLSPADRSLIETTVDLTFYRPEVGEFTVTLPRVALARRSSMYCLRQSRYSNRCQITADRQHYLTNWPRWHEDFFIALSGLMTLSLMGFGTFLLTNNVIEEHRQGTLNFVRMSPRSALTVLGGKLAGVPICLYLAIAAMVPLQIYVGRGAGIGSFHLWGFDLAVLSQTLILYMAGLLLGLATRSPLLQALMPWLAAAGGLALQWVVGAISIHIWEHYLSTAPASALNWAVLFSPIGSAGYFLNIDGSAPSIMEVGSAASALPPLNLSLSIFRVNFAEYTALTMLHAAGWCAVFGHALQRRFEQPTQSLMARRYGYPLTGVFMAIVLGLSETQAESYDLLPILVLITFLGLLYSLALILSLSCDRQTLQDWARFRTARTSHEGRLPLGRDLLIGDTSSPVIAIGLNLVLMATLFTLWLLLHHRQLFATKLAVWGFVGSLCLFVGSLFFAVLANQVLLLSKRQKSWFWYSSIGSLSCLLFPGLTLAIGVGLLPTAVSRVTIWGLPSEVAMFAMPASLMGG
ncbi:hypothetical protein [Halomicronema sp. CCY15110]|uniref:hypothetical protein n=1 Tax=Halomicronema sp. CCY15110 TaxID=2767773 RepID=UPI00195129DF|nr:hypothetical protein [Halomicronema sp. CCY15110]